MKKGKKWTVLLFTLATMTAGCGVHEKRVETSGDTLSFSSKRNPRSKEPLHDITESALTRLRPLAEEIPSDPWYRPVDFDVTHYDIDISADPVLGHIRGTSTVRFRSLKDSLTWVSLDAVSMRVSQVRDMTGRPLPFTYDGRTLYAELRQKPDSGQEAGISVHYETSRSQSFFLTGPDITDPGRMTAGYTYTQPNGSQEWFPCLDRPDAKAPADIRVSVPGGFSALSNGVRLRLEENEFRRIFSYRMEQPVAPYLISLAIGPYSIRSIGSYQGKPLTLWAPPAIADAAERDTAATAEMMRSFGEFTGLEYPYDSYAQSVAQAWGSSMEHQAATTMGGWRIRGDRSGEGVVAHELAHQWFGDWVTCERWSELWLNEGFASYLPVIWFRDSGQVNQSLDYEIWFRESYFREARTAPRALSTEMVDINNIFDSHAYDKGALVISLMRFVADSMPRASGDTSNFTLALKDYLERNGGQNVRNTDLQTSLERVTGRSWQTFFSQWVRSPGHPRLNVSWSKGRNPEITVRQMQKSQSSPWRLFTFPLQIELLGASGERKVETVQVYDEQHRFSLNPGFPVTAINTDPEWHLPAEFTNPAGLDNWLEVLKHSPSVRSRINAVRAIFAGNKAKASPWLIKILADDPSLYVPTESLSLMSNNPENYQAIRQLWTLIREKSGQPGFDRSIEAALSLTDVWLTIRQESVPDSDARYWQESYLIAGNTWEREAIMKKLTHWNREKAQLFAMERLQESHWVTKDRSVLIDLLSKEITPSSIEFLKTAINDASIYWAKRIINNLADSPAQDIRLVAPLQEAVRSRRYTSTRITAVRALGRYTSHKDVVCPVLNTLQQSIEGAPADVHKIRKSIGEQMEVLSCDA